MQDIYRHLSSYGCFVERIIETFYLDYIVFLLVFVKFQKGLSNRRNFILSPVHKDFNFFY